MRARRTRRRSFGRRRQWSAQVSVIAFGAFAVLVAGVGWARTAASQVEGSRVHDGVYPVTIEQLAPAACKGRGLDTLIFAVDAVTVGTLGNDLILGMPGAESISGEGGWDCIVAGDGVDVVVGGPGDDVLLLGPGDDEGFGSVGFDVLYGGAGNDSLKGSQDDDVLHGGDGDDRLDGKGGFDVCNGNAGADTFKNCELENQ